VFQRLSKAFFFFFLVVVTAPYLYDCVYFMLMCECLLCICIYVCVYLCACINAHLYDCVCRQTQCIASTRSRLRREMACLTCAIHLKWIVLSRTAGILLCMHVCMHACMYVCMRFETCNRVIHTIYLSI
jgi:hypothetical protein